MLSSNVTMLLAQGKKKKRERFVQKDFKKFQYICNCFPSVQSLIGVRLFATHGLQHTMASLSIIDSLNLLKLMTLDLVTPSNHLILCHPLLFLPSIFPSIRVFSKESFLPIRWPKYWSFSCSISTSNEYLGLISFRMD